MVVEVEIAQQEQRHQVHLIKVMLADYLLQVVTVAAVVVAQVLLVAMHHLLLVVLVVLVFLFLHLHLQLELVYLITTQVVVVEEFTEQLALLQAV